MKRLCSIPRLSVLHECTFAVKVKVCFACCVNVELNSPFNLCKVGSILKQLPKYCKTEEMVLLGRLSLLVSERYTP